MNVPRDNAARAVLNGYIDVAGGWGNCNPFNSVDLYDPNCDEWIEVKPVNKN